MTEVGKKLSDHNSLLLTGQVINEAKHGNADSKINLAGNNNKNTTAGDV